MSYKNIITWAKINQIRSWEPLEIETIQSKKDMKYSKEFGYAGHMLPLLIYYMIIHQTLTYWGIILSMINPIHTTYSPTYPSVETGDMHRYWQWQWQYCWGKLLLCSSLLINPITILGCTKRPLMWYYIISSKNPEWPHPQCVGLEYPCTDACSRPGCCSKSCGWERPLLWNPLIYPMQYVELRTLWRVGITASQLDLPSLTPLSVAGCGRLQLGAPIGCSEFPIGTATWSKMF